MKRLGVFRSGRTTEVIDEMTCSDVQRLLARDVTLEGAKEAQAHVQSCTQCQAFRDRMLALDALLAQWQCPEAPDWLPAKISARLAALETGRPTQVPRWGLVLERVLVPLVVASGLILGALLGSHLNRLLQPASVETAGIAESESSLVVDPLTGSFTEAVENVAFATAGGNR